MAPSARDYIGSRGAVWIYAFNAFVVAVGASEL